MPYTTITSWARLIWEALGTYGIDAAEVWMPQASSKRLMIFGENSRDP